MIPLNRIMLGPVFPSRQNGSHNILDRVLPTHLYTLDIIGLNFWTGANSDLVADIDGAPDIHNLRLESWFSRKIENSAALNGRITSEFDHGAIIRI
jgi:hypothetical protein